MEAVEAVLRAAAEVAEGRRPRRHPSRLREVVAAAKKWYKDVPVLIITRGAENDELRAGERLG